VTARGALLADLDDGRVLFRKGSDVPRPIASLTKIMTALLVLERTELTDTVVVDQRAVYEAGDYGATSTLGLRAGERRTVEDLLYALLLGSANDAADALAIHVDGSVEAFVERMNRRAGTLGMIDTRFYSPSGLDDRGRSTPADLLRLIRVADARPVFRRIVATRFHTIPAPSGPDRRIQNRNVLLWLYPGADGAKTGSTAAADACLVATASRDGRRLVAIVLGAPQEAFSDAAALLNHGFDGFTQRTLVTSGEARGSVRVRGGEVPVVAAHDLQALVPTAALGGVRESIEVDPGAAFPPAPGEAVATLRLRAAGLVLGSVPLVVAEVPAPPETSGPWWMRSAATVTRAVTDAVSGLAS
jgi:D-alanyl-D-alanine carboxypeptidase (penicillin-binding protein 5/6)